MRLLPHPPVGNRGALVLGSSPRHWDPESISAATGPWRLSPLGRPTGIFRRSLTTGNLGANSETLSFTPRDLNVSGFSSLLPNLNLTIDFTVQSRAQPIVNSPTSIAFPNVRVGTPENSKVSVTNSASSGGTSPDASW